jgi:transposase-like protein
VLSDDKEGIKTMVRRKAERNLLRLYLCPHCRSNNLSYFGWDRLGQRRYKCNKCEKTFKYPKVKNKRGD